MREIHRDFITIRDDSFKNVCGEEEKVLVQEVTKQWWINLRCMEYSNLRINANIQNRSIK